MGTVYAGRIDGLSGYLAIKLVHDTHAANAEFRRRFAREARLLARVDSPCVARFVQADVEAAQPWLATEYVPGPTLRHHVERRGRLRDGMLLGLAAGVAEALRALHSAGIVHRDLKPGNVLLAPSGPKVFDLGIAYSAEDTTRWLRLRRMRRRARDLGLADTAAVPNRSGNLGAGSGDRERVGTPGWISPEQYRGEPVTERSDVFLWGALVAFAAARRNPFGHASAAELARRVRTEEPDLEGLPPGLEELVVTAMAKDPAQRPEAAGLLKRTLALDPSGTEAGSERRRVQALLERGWTRVSARPAKPPLWPDLLSPSRRRGALA